MDNEKLEQLGRALGLKPRCPSCKRERHHAPCHGFELDYSWLPTAEGAAAVRAALAERGLDWSMGTRGHFIYFDVFKDGVMEFGRGGTNEITATLESALRALEMDLPS